MSSGFLFLVKFGIFVFCLGREKRAVFSLCFWPLQVRRIPDCLSLPAYDLPNISP